MATPKTTPMDVSGYPRIRPLNGKGGVIIDITGLKVGRLTVEGMSHHASGQIYWNCKCECGRTKAIMGGALRGATTLSCGCIQKSAVSASNGTHYLSGHKLHGVWASMKARCLNPNVRYFHCYGGRGIKVCDRWLSGDNTRTGFECFWADMAWDYQEGLTIERRDNNGNYDPMNCCWATYAEQVRNRRKRSDWTIETIQRTVLARTKADGGS